MRISTLLALTLTFIGTVQGSPLQNQSTGLAHTDLISSDPSAVLIRYNLTDVTLQTFDVEGSQFTGFPIENEPIFQQDGMPLLPVVTRYVVIPPNSAVKLIVTEEGTPLRIHPANPPLVSNNPEFGEPTIKPGEDGLYPPNIAEISTPVILRGVRMVLVTVYPVQYDFNSGTFLKHNNIQTEVRVTDGEVINPVTQPIRRGRTREFLRMISLFAINGDQVGRDDPERDEIPRYNGHYLIVSHEALLRFVAPYIEWRRKAGYKIDIYSVPANQANSPDVIRDSIRVKYMRYVNNHQEPFEYVLAVGDRSAYYEMQNPATVLESPQGTPSFNPANHADYLYGCLEGNDELPDVATGRWAGGNADLVGLMVGRTLAYEATPDMRNPSWFTRGGAISQHWGNGQEAAYHITIPSMVRWAEAILKNQGYTNVRFQESLDFDQYGANTGPVFRGLFNDGANAVLARSENYYWATRNPNRHYFDQDVNDNTVFPFRLNASGHGEWSAEMEFRTGSANHLKGWVGVTFSWNGPDTRVSTSLWSDEVQAVMCHDLPLGWGYSYAIAHLEAGAPGVNYAMGRTEHNYMGDPGLKVWRGVPRVVEMETPASISPQARLVEVFVHQPDSDTPVPGARVTLYAPGNLPAFDNAGYATYSRFWIKNSISDADGIARFVFESTDTLRTATNLFATVTGDDVAPCFRQTRIEAQNAVVEIGGIEYEENEGNDDARLNPGESFFANLTGRNIGQNVAEATYATVTSLSPYIEVEDDNEVFFGDIAAGESNGGNRAVFFTILPTCPDATARPVLKPSILVEFTSGDQTWRSAFNLDTWAPHLEFRSIDDGDIIPDSSASINVEIANIGRINSSEISVELHSAGQGVTVIDGSSSFPSISPGRTARLNGGSFDISGNKVVVPGSRSDLYMVFNTASGFVDTSYFSVQIMSPRAGAPIGPDKYGYICFDDTDTLWDIAPEYDWVEINPDDNQAQLDGVRLNFRGQSARDLGEVIVIPLGFTTQFYGRDYDTITVCSNGYVAMGNLPHFSNHHNYRLDSGVGAVGVIAPFWDDLRFSQNTRIFACRDTVDSRFIVEWYRMAPATGEADQTFQIIIYDKSIWITESGDPNILMQYKTIQNLQNIRGNDNANNPFASVGICSPTGNTGINYTSNNQYPTGAAPLAARRAILYTTSVRFRAGTLYGRVTDAATGWGVEGATVYTKQGFVATTDVDGYWRIAEALADILFDITAHKQGYNDSTYTSADDSLRVPEGDSLEINFDLLHPEFSPTNFELSAILDPGMTIDLGFSLTNTGNGPMDWNAEKRLLGDADAEPWELRRRYNVGRITDDDRIEGVIFAQDKFFLSGANGIDSANLIYVLDRDGELLNRFEQIGSSRYGYKDMDWDGNYLWAAGEDSIYCLTTDGQVVTSWPDPLNPSQYIAYNSEEGILYLCGTTTSTIVRCDLEGHVLEGALSRRSLRMYGLGYWPEDPDGYDLYIVNHPSGTPTNITKMNVATGDTMFVFEIPQDSSSSGQQSAWITNEFDVYSWVFMSIQNVSAPGGGDRVEIHQLDARKDWMNLDVWSGRLETGETQDFIVNLNSTGLPDTLFQGEMYFSHNADSGRAHISIALQVIGPVPPAQFELALPVDGDTLTALPLRGDTLHLPAVEFVWFASRDLNANDFVQYMFTISAADSSVSFNTSDTSITLNLDTLGLPLWYDMPLVWSVKARSAGDEIPCVRPYTMHILPDDINREKSIAPVEFALQAIYPNPFNGRTAIRFGADISQRTSLIAYDLDGREVARLFDAVPTVGYHTLTWNAEQLPTGIYVIRLKSAGRTRVAKLALIK